MIAHVSQFHLEFADAIIPPPALDVDEWADNNRIMDSSFSPEPGPWRTKRVPYLRKILKVLSPSHPAREVTAMMAAQLAKSETIINCICYVADVEPASMMYLAPTDGMVEKFSKQRLAPSFGAIPSLRSKITDAPRGRDSGSNTIMIKTFPGGSLILGSASSGAALRSFPIKYLFEDEVDAYPAEIKGEGDPVELAEKRTANYRNRKIFRASTPTLEETSRIKPLFELGTQEEYFVPCPKCKHMQVIGFHSHMRWDRDADGEPINIHMECENRACRNKIEESYKTWMLENGEWRAKFPGRDHYSFHLSALYSPVGFFSWKDAVKQFLRATDKRDKNLLQAFINTVLAETFSVTATSEFDARGLAATRPAKYKSAVPAGALFLTCGVDVQADRLEMEVIGWGKDEESWRIEYRVLLGDPQQRAVWIELDAQLRRTWHHESGTDLPLACTLIDSGDQAQVVYNFCADKAARRIFPSKGQDGFGRGFFRRSTGKVKGTAYLFLLYVDELKTRVYSHLKIDEAGPGFCHFPQRPEYDERYFRGLTSETLVTRHTLGTKKLRWSLPKGRRNEPLDLAVLNTGAYHIIHPSLAPLVKEGKPYAPNYSAAAGARGRRGMRVLSQGAG